MLTGPVSGFQRVRTGTMPLAAILAVFLAVVVFEAYRTAFWFDELSTYFMSATPTLGDLWRASPTDGNPPLYFLLARAALHLPVKMELALRVPAIIAYLLAAVTVYRFVLRAVAMPPAALLATAIFVGSGIVRYAIEARPYALLLLLTGTALRCWQEIRGSHRRVALVGLAGSIFAACLTHQYGIFYTTLPVLAGEVFRVRSTRRLDIPLLGAMLLGCTAALLTVPATLRAQAPLLQAIRTCPEFWARPGWHSFARWPELLPPVAASGLLGVGVFGLISSVYLSFARPVAQEVRPLPLPDLAAAAMLALFYPVMVLVTHFGSGYFSTRYGAGSAMGIALVAGLLASRRTRMQPLLFSLTGSFVVIGLLSLFVAPDAFRGPSYGRDTFLDAVPGDEPIVVASALQYSPLWWYAAPGLRARLHYLSDLDYAARQSDLVPEFSLALERAWTPMQMDDYAAFLREHRRFLLYCAENPSLEWVRQRVLGEGWHLELLKSKGSRRLYEATR